jgi:hypothetical protein
MLGFLNEKRARKGSLNGNSKLIEGAAGNEMVIQKPVLLSLQNEPTTYQKVSGFFRQTVIAKRTFHRNRSQSDWWGTRHVWGNEKRI